MEKQLVITLRPVVADDETFLFRVYASTRADEMALVAWSAEEQEAFVRMQFDAQRKHYAAQCPNARFDVILGDGVAVGRLTVDRTSESLHIVDIALLPEHRNAGIATSLILELQAESASAGKPLRMHVETFNRAWRLYERLGFRKVSERGLYWLLEWRAGEDPDAMTPNR